MKTHSNDKKEVLASSKVRDEIDKSMKITVIYVSSRMKGLCPSAQMGEKKYKYKDVITSTYSASQPRLGADLETER